MNLKFFYHLYSHKIYFWLFFLLLIAQVFFWKQTESYKTPAEIVPPPPNKYLISAFSLGDQEFLFRVLAMRFQNSGDVFAGRVALKDYDYSRLYYWMKALDELNWQSNVVPSLAAYYFSQTQNHQDTKYIVDYLDEHASRDIDQKWWWLFQGIYVARDRLKDMDRALDLAKKLSQNNAQNAPFWTKQMPAFLYEESGNACMAFAVIQKLIAESESGVRQIKPQEMDFMRYFIKERLSKLQQQKFDPRKCPQI